MRLQAARGALGWVGNLEAAMDKNGRSAHAFPRGARVVVDVAAVKRSRRKMPDGAVTREWLTRAWGDPDIGTVVAYYDPDETGDTSVPMVVWDNLADGVGTPDDGMPTLWAWNVPTWALRVAP